MNPEFDVLSSNYDSGYGGGLHPNTGGEGGDFSRGTMGGLNSVAGR